MEGFVNIPVPVEYVPQVYALLGKLAGEPDEGKDLQMVSGEWTEKRLQQLSAEPRASVARVAKMMDLLSKEPDQPIAYAEVARSLGITHGELQGALSGFSRWIRTIWGDDDGWPMTVTSRRSAESQDTETHYIVATTTAKRWLAVRSRG
jgi:hypothetical protein